MRTVEKVLKDMNKNFFIFFKYFFIFSTYFSIFFKYLSSSIHGPWDSEKLRELTIERGINFKHSSGRGGREFSFQRVPQKRDMKRVKKYNKKRRQ